MNRVLVTGGAGFIGSHLVDRLVAEGSKDVIVLDNLRRGRVEDLKASWDRIRFVQGDVRAKPLVRRLMAGVDLVYHLAAESRVMEAEEDLERTFTTNVQGTFNVLSTALEAEVKRVVFTSSREVYGDAKQLPVSEDAPLAPKNAYGASKAAAELWCKIFQSRGLDVVILRLANVYGPRDHGRVIPLFIERAGRGEPLIVYGGRQVLDFIWVGDVIDVLVRVASLELASVCGPVNVGSGRPVALTALAEEIRACFGNRVQIRLEPARLVEVQGFVADTSRLRALLGIPADGQPLAHLRELVERSAAVSGDGAWR